MVSPATFLKCIDYVKEDLGAKDSYQAPWPKAKGFQQERPGQRIQMNFTQLTGGRLSNLYFTSALELNAITPKRCLAT